MFHCNAFTWKCPENSQWFLRSETKCKDQAYSCLFDTKHSTYKEICRKGEDIGREGKMFHLIPINITFYKFYDKKCYRNCSFFLIRNNICFTSVHYCILKVNQPQL